MKGLSSKERATVKLKVEEALEKYRMCKYLAFEERQASITASYEAREHGPTNVTSDQTAQTAIYNVDTQAYRKAYCERIERAVRRLPGPERQIIELRYMTTDTDYITDQHVYDFKLEPPMSAPTYIRIRDLAMYKIYLIMGLDADPDTAVGGMI